MKNISTIDLVVIVLYLAGIVGAGIWVGLRKRKGGEAGGYFLADNTLGWSSIGLALWKSQQRSKADALLRPRRPERG